MKSSRSLIFLLALGALASFWPSSAATEEGVALAIVYDTSGSMSDSVRSGSGRSEPKYIIAQRALAAVVKRLQDFTTSAAVSGLRKMEAGLYVFNGGKVSEFAAFGPFAPQSAANWTRNLPAPSGGTPLGEALRTAAQAVSNSPMARKHVLVITDGINTVGPDPAAVLPGLKKQAEQRGSGLSVHFVAFDVDAKVFDPVKKLGATVVGASDEAQLNTQLSFILEKKILLEDEEPPKK